jgi:hypothetical protein
LSGAELESEYKTKSKRSSEHQGGLHLNTSKRSRVIFGSLLSILNVPNGALVQVVDCSRIGGLVERVDSGVDLANQFVDFDFSDL